MGLPPARLVMADAVDHFERGNGIGGDAGLFLELARGAGINGLAQLLRAAGETPAADARRHRALREENAAAPPHHGEAADDRAAGEGAAGKQHGRIGLSQPYAAVQNWMPD